MASDTKKKYCAPDSFKSEWELFYALLNESDTETIGDGPELQW